MITKHDALRFDALRKDVDRLLDELIARFYREVPAASAMATGTTIDMDLYKRHNVETVLRIRLKRVCDALAIRYFTKRDPVQAKAWSHYTEDEMLHDRMFVRDLKAVGMTEEEVYATEPFVATRLMMGYLLYDLEYLDTPLALISSVYFVEYTTTRTQPRWLDNLEKILGKDKIAGARAHANIDVDDKHDDFVWGVLASLIDSPEKEKRVMEHMRNVYQLYKDYFFELQRHVTESRSAREPAQRSSELAPV